VRSKHLLSRRNLPHPACGYAAKKRGIGRELLRLSALVGFATPYRFSHSQRYCEVAHWAVPRFPVRIWLPNWGLITEFSMKYAFCALVLLGWSIIAAPSFAADARNVSVVNETGYAIKFLGLQRAGRRA